MLRPESAKAFPSGVVALIDWNWKGHHPTYFTQFAAEMAKAGAEVVPFCPEPADFQERLVRCELPQEIRRRIHTPTKIFGMPQSGFRPLKWRKHYEALRFFWGHGHRLRQWQAKHGRKIDLVFFACIYDRHFEHFRLAERFFGFPWSGLYLHARSFRMPGSPLPYQGGLPCPERFLTMDSMQSVAILDEGIVQGVQAMSGGKSVAVIPDFTDDRVPQDSADASRLALKVKSRAGERPIVSLTGHLQWTKGLEDFTALAQALPDVFFFLSGDVSWTEVPEAKRRWMQEQWEQGQNVWAHLQYVSNDQALNKVVAVSDVVFAAYRSFPNSSNILTKAAVLERPVLVSDGYLMAERTKSFGLGEVVPEGDRPAMAAALRRMLEPDYYPKMQTTARWAEYRALHSQDRLGQVFRDLLAVVSGG